MKQILAAMQENQGNKLTNQKTNKKKTCVVILIKTENIKIQVSITGLLSILVFVVPSHNNEQ